MTKSRLLILTFLLILFAAGYDTSPTATPASTQDFNLQAASPAPAKFVLTSPNLKDGENLADKFTYKLLGQCNGENFSPALGWTSAPAGTQSFALTVLDPDGGNWLHWLLFDIPVDTTSLPETPGGSEIGTKGKNDFGSLGYGGPCPPSGTHHYIFTLYALDTKLNLPEGSRLGDFEKAIHGHILAQAQLTGLRAR